MGDVAHIDTRLRVADSAGIAEAVRILRAGGPVAIPTETVYGLAADAASDTAVAGIYSAKGRPSFNPLIVHVADLSAAQQIGHFSPLSLKLAERFWPGPLTLVVPLADAAAVSPLVTAGLSTVALRVPAHPVMQTVLAEFGRGVAAPSANASGRISSTTALHVIASLGGRIPLVLDGGPTRAGLESSILSLASETPTLLRHGAIALEELEEAAGARISVVTEGSDVAAPGMLLRHYAPRLPLSLDVTDRAPGTFHIGFGAIEGDMNLSSSADLAEAAARLFAALHLADASGARRIAVAPIPERGIGLAIHDRLRRAARG